jgi:TPP-dependent pyruvate/acetoin dehydrogenase alpha subunit
VAVETAKDLIAGDKLRPEDFDRLYRSLRRIRRVEEGVARLYPSDKIKSPVHLSIGQEFVAVGVCDVLRPEDVVSPTYRCHAAFLAKGGDLKGMMAELYGKAGGVAGGKGGSMHLIDMSHNILGASAVVGTTVPITVGYGLVFRRMKLPRVAVTFFGDGATEEGVFSESLNFAALHKLPVLFVCENNGYAIHTPLDRRWASRQLCERVATYGIPTHRIEDGDILMLRKIAAQAVEAMRRGESGPVFIECLTYRWREHVGPNEDYDAGYRSRADLEPWLANDQVESLGKRLPHGRRSGIDAAIEREIAEAIAFAEKSPFPLPEALGTHVFAGE